MAAEVNPYRSPNSIEPAQTAAKERSSRRSAQNRVRLSVLLGVAGGVHFGVFYLIFRLAHASGSADRLYLWYGFTWCMGLLAAAMLCGWFLLYPAMELTARLVRMAVASNVPEDEWLLATDRSLWPFPYAAGLGLVTWLVYWRVEFYLKGRAGAFNLLSDELIMGVLAQGLGAWCYLTIFYYWIRVWRRFQPAS